MTVKEYYKHFCEKIPSSLSMDWDNDGLMCCPDETRTVRKILVVLDITERVVEHAVDGGYDLILAHHPLIFRGVKSLTENDGAGRKLLLLVKHGITAMSFHTRLDAVTGGVNDVLAELLGLHSVTPFGADAIPVGRVGDLERECTPAELAEAVKKALGAPCVTLSDAGKKIRRVAVLGGSGKDDIGAAVKAGADAYVSGELGYHAMVDAPENGITLVEAGHFYTEYPVCRRLEALAKEADPTVETEIFCSNALETV